KMAFDPLRQWGQDRPAIRRDPAFALVTGRADRNHEVLHQKGLVPLEAGSGRDLGRDHLLFNSDPGRDLAPTTPPLIFYRFRLRGTVVHAARFDARAALQTFQTGDFFALFGNGLLQGGDFTEQFDQQSFKLWTAERGKGGRRRHMMQRVHRRESAQEKNAAVPGLLLLLPRNCASARKSASTASCSRCRRRRKTRSCRSWTAGPPSRSSLRGEIRRRGNGRP